MMKLKIDLSVTEESLSGAEEALFEETVRDEGFSLGEKSMVAPRGMYMWQLNTPEGTPLDTLRIGIDSNKKEYVLDKDGEEQRDSEPRRLLRSVRMSPTLSIQNPAI